MYIDKRRKTVTYNDIRSVIREAWPDRKQLPLNLSSDEEWWSIAEIIEKVTFNRDLTSEIPEAGNSTES